MLAKFAVLWLPVSMYLCRSGVETFRFLKPVLLANKQPQCIGRSCPDLHCRSASFARGVSPRADSLIDLLAGLQKHQCHESQPAVCRTVVTRVSNATMDRQSLLAIFELVRHIHGVVLPGARLTSYLNIADHHVDLIRAVEGRYTAPVLPCSC